jgi:hypothetical protein
MRKSLVRIKGVGFLVWHGRHYLFHILYGLMWAWFLREIRHEFNTRWIVAAVTGSVIPDLDHMLYFTTYGKRDPYTRSIVKFLKTHQWRVLIRYIETGHKNQVSLTFHNFYSTAVVLGLTILSFVMGWHFWTFLFGAMVTHYVFDVVDDWLQLGRLNPNWRRLGRGNHDDTIYH